jgi:ABC-type multidrug transport system ATPase subunit
VAIAVALANHAPLLLLDEPTGALDRASAAQVMELLRELRARYGLTVLMATHDLSVAKYADRVLTLRDGALGQDLSREAETSPTLDGDGHIYLPDAVRAQLADAARIAVEIRPEGVLLRPETESDDDFSVRMWQDAPPAPRRRKWFRRTARKASTES